MHHILAIFKNNFVQHQSFHIFFINSQLKFNPKSKAVYPGSVSLQQSNESTMNIFFGIL